MQCRQLIFADQYKGGFLLNPISRSTLSNSGKTSIIERGSQSSLVLCGRYSLSKVLRHHPNVCSARSQDCTNVKVTIEEGRSCNLCRRYSREARIFP